MVHPTNAITGRAGFSLVELLVVMAIVSGLMVMVIGGGDSWGEAAAERGAASQLAGALDRARAHAIATDGFAACVIAGEDAGDKAWRRVAVAALTEDPAAASGFPYLLADASDTPGIEAPADPVDLVMPWTDLPTGMIAFGKMHGASMEAAVDDSTTLQVPVLKDGPTVGCKVVVFNGQGAVVHPASKARRCLRVGPGEGSGRDVTLQQADRAAAMPVITVERFTGRIQIAR